ncbi:hypothetical protein PENTCL1PPCAC_1078, partial [Pristionchus entomophagus]
ATRVGVFAVGIPLVILMKWKGSEMYAGVEGIIGEALTAFIWVSLCTFLLALVLLGYEDEQEASPSRCTLISRLIAFIALFLLMILYCVFLVIFGVTQLEKEAPALLIVGPWLLSLYPVFFFSNRAVRRVRRIGMRLIGPFDDAIDY